MARVLLVDDSAALRESLQRALARRGHDVSALSRGDAALNLAPEAHFDVIVTDLLMPGTNGIELVRRLAARYPSVPILAMSGGGRVSPLEQLDRAHAEGASSTLAKPFGLRELLARIEHLLLLARKRSGPSSSISSTDASTPLIGSASAEGHPSRSAATPTTLQARPFEPRPGNLRHS